MTQTVEKIATKTTYGETLIRMGKANPRIVAVESDLMKASGSDMFEAEFPDRHFQVGIAEQNMVGFAAGLAAMGKIPFASTFSNFISQRACDQAINAVCYNKFNVKLCGTYAGLTSETNGGTHISVEDIAIFRCMPNMLVFVPGDCNEMASAMEVAAAYDGPVYIRIARGPMPTIFPENHQFVIGKSVPMSEGDDICLITTGITTWEGQLACEELKTRGVAVHHIHMPSIKPIDRDAIVDAARKTGRIVTVENHSRLGGLGSAVTEVVCDEHPVRVARLGLDDCFGETAKLDYLMNRFGTNAKHIVHTVETLLKGNES